MLVDCSQTPHQSSLSGSRNRGNAADAEKEEKADVLVRLRRRAFRHPLPTILLVNVQSLDNKLCELRARISYQRETRDCCVICLTETWMSAMVPDSAIELTGFSVHRSDRMEELTGKSRGGGVCFYIRCTDLLIYDHIHQHKCKNACQSENTLNWLTLTLQLIYVFSCAFVEWALCYVRTDCIVFYV